jgi:hypothetical protein
LFFCNLIGDNEDFLDAELLAKGCKKQPAKKHKNAEAEGIQAVAISAASRKSSLSPIRLQKNKLEVRVHYVCIIHINS